MNTRRQFQTCLLVVSILLTSLPVTSVAARPNPAAPVNALPQTTEAFKFGKVDLELLEEVGLLDKRFEKEGLIYHEPELEAYLDNVGQKVVADKQLENVVWKFHALRDPSPNAVALPNGSIYINTGLLALLEDEGQLAGVLAHEAIHVSRRHGYLQNRSVRKKVLAINIFSTIATWNPVGGAAGAAINAIANISPFILVLSIFGYSRELEKEADLQGLKNVTAAGYAPEEMANSFRMLQKDIDGEQLSSFYNDHPKLQDRIGYISSSIDPAAAKLTEDQSKKAKTDYLAVTELVDRHDIELAIQAERFRSAVFISQKLVDFHPDSSANVYYLAESYRALGPRSPVLTDKEHSGGAKKKAAKEKRKRTLEEQDEELLKTTAGQEAWKANREKAEQLYLRALDLNRFNFVAHRGMGMLYERSGRKDDAVHAYSKYLELAPPGTADVERFKRRREILKASLAGETAAPAPTSTSPPTATPISTPNPIAPAPAATPTPPPGV